MVDVGGAVVKPAQPGSHDKSDKVFSDISWAHHNSQPGQPAILSDAGVQSGRLLWMVMIFSKQASYVVYRLKHCSGQQLAQLAAIQIVKLRLQHDVCTRSCQLKHSQMSLLSQACPRGSRVLQSVGQSSALWHFTSYHLMQENAIAAASQSDTLTINNDFRLK